ncbi:hypothetical protein Ddye_025756 [Dipteronia dyeriana]|uniref:Uncharacterized protein n=1 Tax=Dipteronia dyeriana TaxID=168575 RepID=A0AAD9TL00_9ROSI|nr:hypothetical protein Ddye_025756 [Dipteronia dyeriana]
MTRDSVSDTVSESDSLAIPKTSLQDLSSNFSRHLPHFMAAVPVEEAIAALSTFSLEDEQPEVQGPAVLVSTEKGSTESPVEYSDVNAYRWSLSEEKKALNQLLPSSMKHSQAHLSLETYQVLDLEMSRLHEIQRWQASAASKVLPVLVVLATSSEKDSRSLYKRVKINRLINIFKSDPVIPAFPDLHFSSAAILKELSMYFLEFSAQTHLLTLPAPHEIPPWEAQEYPVQNIVFYKIFLYDFMIRFASAMNQLLLLKSTDGADVEWGKEVKGNMYDMFIEGKLSRPCKDAVPSESNETSASYSDYEKVVWYNYSAEERKAMVELVSYIKSIRSMMLRCDTLVADALWETIHAEVQDFVQYTLTTMLRTTFRNKEDLSRLVFICIKRFKL